MGHVGHDRHIGLETARDHLRPAQADLFLHRVDHMQGVGQLDLLLLQPPGHLSDHKPADAVIQRPPHKIAFVQHHQLVVKGDHITDMNPQFLHFLFGTAAAVEENILHRGGCIVFLIPNMDRRPAEDGLDDPVVGMNVNPLGRGDQGIGAPVADHVDVTVVRDVVHEPGDLVGMGFDHHLVIFPGIDGAHGGAVDIAGIFIDIRLDVIQPDLLP